MHYRYARSMSFRDIEILAKLKIVVWKEKLSDWQEYYEIDDCSLRMKNNEMTQITATVVTDEEEE